MCKIEGKSDQMVRGTSPKKGFSHNFNPSHNIVLFWFSDNYYSIIVLDIASAGSTDQQLVKNLLRLKDTFFKLKTKT